MAYQRCLGQGCLLSLCFLTLGSSYSQVGASFYDAFWTPMFVFRRCTTLWSRLGVLAISVHGCDLPQHSFLLDIKVLGVCLFGYVLLVLKFSSASQCFFLAEKVHIVWSPKVGIRRLESPVYLICITCVSFYCIVITFLFSGKYRFLFFDPRSTLST